MRLVKNVRTCPVLVVKANSKGPYIRATSAAAGGHAHACRNAAGRRMSVDTASASSSYVAVRCVSGLAAVPGPCTCGAWEACRNCIISAHAGACACWHMGLVRCTHYHAHAAHGSALCKDSLAKNSAPYMNDSAVLQPVHMTLSRQLGRTAHASFHFVCQPHVPCFCMYRFEGDG